MKTKILFLINTLNGGGAEKVLVDTVNNLDSEKYDITVQTIYDVGVFKNKLSDKVRYKSIIRSKNNIAKRIYSKILLSVLGVKFVYNHFIRSQYDYEIAFLEGLPTKVISKSTNKHCKKYAWIHTDLISNPNSLNAYGCEFNEREAYKSFDKIFCVSDSVRRSFNEKYGMNDKSVTVYNIIDDKAIEEAGGEPVDLPVCTQPIIVSVGRLTKPKGYERLLRIHKRLIDEGYSHSLLIIGDGEQRSMLESYVKENHLDQTVFLLGFQINPHKFIKQCDLFVCSSIAEGYSTVVSESVLCGVPVLSTDVAGSLEPIEAPRCSIVVENSEQALYEGIKNILENPEKLKLYKDGLKEIQVRLRKDFLISEFERKVLDE